MKAAPVRPQLSETPTILVVEDEPVMLRILHLAIVARGYDVLEAVTGRRAVELARERAPGLVLLNLDLSEMDGLDVAGRIRERSSVPIVALSSRSAEADVVEALDRGINDYVTKPFREAELFARIRASLRASTLPAQRDWVLGNLRADATSRRVSVQGKEVKLSVTEFNLLFALARASGGVVTPHELARTIWGTAPTKEVARVRVYIHHLREKLEPDPRRPRYLLTETGSGYRLCASTEPTA